MCIYNNINFHYYCLKFHHAINSKLLIFNASNFIRITKLKICLKKTMMMLIYSLIFTLIYFYHSFIFKLYLHNKCHIINVTFTLSFIYVIQKTTHSHTFL